MKVKLRSKPKLLGTMASAFGIIHVLSCGSDAPPRALFDKPQSARVYLALRQEGAAQAATEPRSFPRPSSSNFATSCLSLLLETPAMRSSPVDVTCLKLGPVPESIRSQTQNEEGALVLALTSDEQRAALGLWLADGLVLLRFSAPIQQDEDSLLRLASSGPSGK